MTTKEARELLANVDYHVDSDEGDGCEFGRFGGGVPCSCGLEARLQAIEQAAVAAFLESPDSLDGAWKRAEAALPEGWKIERVGRVWLQGMGYLDRWQAIAVPSVRKGRDWRQKFVAAADTTPAAALNALAAQLQAGRKEPDHRG